MRNKNDLGHFIRKFIQRLLFIRFSGKLNSISVTTGREHNNRVQEPESTTDRIVILFQTKCIRALWLIFVTIDWVYDKVAQRKRWGGQSEEIALCEFGSVSDRQLKCIQGIFWLV